MKAQLAPALFALLAGAAASAPLLRGSGADEAASARPWPTHFEGRPIAPLPAAPEDKLLARSFPGHVARFTDGRRQIVLRQVAAPTRRLHPASDCFRAAGYEIGASPMQVAPGRGPASCFSASKDGRTLRACERVAAGNGRSWPDISSWYWSAVFGRQEGPWLASLTVETLKGSE